MSFLETPRFPDNLSYGSVGGPEYATGVAVLQSGHEQRNAIWTYPRNSYNAKYAIQDRADMDVIISFFHTMKGRWYGFRYKDWLDFKSCSVVDTPAQTDQTIGTGDGVETQFQIIKTYTTGALTQTRKITKPISGTLLVEVNGVLQTETTHYTVDYATGIITFVAPVTDTHVIKCGYEFDVPCRFDSDKLDVNADFYEVRSSDIIIREIRL